MGCYEINIWFEGEGKEQKLLEGMEMSGTGGGFGPTQVWDTVQSWFTPTILFLLVNIVIGTIAITSRMLGNDNNNNENPNALKRAPSLLTRFSSMSFIKRENEQPWIQPQETAAEDNVVEKEEVKMIPEKKEDVKMIREKKEDVKMIQEKKRPSRGGASSGLSQITGNVKNRIPRSKSDAAPLLDLHPPPPPLPGKIKKSETFELSHSQERDLAVVHPTVSSVSEHFHEEPAAEVESAEGVDAKADDFINKFKQQLKLQRLESLMRYRETLNRNI